MAITLLNGPAAGEHLWCRRCPMMLRVVRGPGGGWDALDLPTDTPARNEEIHVYIMHGDVAEMCICRRGGGGGPQQVADYVYLDDQPADADVRTNDRWTTWCYANEKRLRDLKAKNDTLPADYWETARKKG